MKKWKFSLNNKGNMGQKEFMIVLLFMILTFAFVFYNVIKTKNMRNYKFLFEKGEELERTIQEYMVNSTITETNEPIYLSDLYGLGKASKLMSPFDSNQECNPYETYVLIGSPNRINVLCSSYLIKNTKINVSTFSVYKVSPWQEVKGHEKEALGGDVDKVYFYNYEKDGKEVLPKYYIEKEFINKYKEKENKSVVSLNNIKEKIKKKEYFRHEVFVKTEKTR